MYVFINLLTAEEADVISVQRGLHKLRDLFEYSLLKNAQREREREITERKTEVIRTALDMCMYSI